MKPFVVLLSLVTLWVPLSAQSQSMYRCEGNYYTNTLQDAKAKGCKLLEGGNVTVVPGTRPASSSAAAPSAKPASPGQKVDSNEQKSRDSDARLILEAELKKAEARQAELQKEYNNGAPEKTGPETRNHQKYLDRVAELKASIARNASDLEGIRRELARLVGSLKQLN